MPNPNLTNRKNSPLRPLPMRITELQWTRLLAAREFDDIAIQEHVRRALDMYLDAVDRRRSRLVPTEHRVDEMPEFVRTPPTVPANQAGVQPETRRRVVYR